MAQLMQALLHSHHAIIVVGIMIYTSVTPDIEQAPGDPRCCTNATHTMFSQSYITRPGPLQREVSLECVAKRMGFFRPRLTELWRHLYDV